MDHRATTFDTLDAIHRVPAKDAPEESWLAWANNYSTLTAAGLVCTRIEAGSAEFTLEEARFPPNPNGAVNGGIVALVVDQAMGVAAIRSTPAGQQPVTIVLETHFHRPAFPPLTLTASLIPGGRTIRTVQVIVLDKNGQQCATATGTMAATPTPGRRTAEPA
jgi:uncharacterized protein (TIGR00369 family)